MNSPWNEPADAESRPLTETCGWSSPIFRWTSEWADLIDFEIEPVVRDDEAGPILKETM